MNTKLTTTIASAALLCGSVIGGGALLSSAGAQDGYSGADPTADVVDEQETASTGDTTTGTTTLVQDADDDSTDGEAVEGEGCHRGDRGEAVAEVLGLSVEELHEARESGASIADIAAEQGVDIDLVVQTVVDQAAEHVAEEVAAGELTQAEADEKLADAEARAIERVNSTEAAGGRHHGPRGERGPDAEAEADATLAS